MSTTTTTETKGQRTRERMVHSAAALFRRKGYDGTGLNEILERSGAPRGSLYFHFPGGKEELAVAALTEAGFGIGSGMESLLSSAKSPSEGIARVIDFLADELERSDYRGGCPIAAVTLDGAAESKAVRDACASVFDRWLELMEARLAEGGWTAPAARRRALITLAAFEGGLTVARAKRDSAPLRALADELRGLAPER
jgi:TetR/AcrR family transcriptional regulator, lmrAB and yxaGH operons repressor